MPNFKQLVFAKYDVQEEDTKKVDGFSKILDEESGREEKDAKPDFKKKHDASVS